MLSAVPSTSVCEVCLTHTSVQAPTGYLHSTYAGGAVDGPGVRYLVFFSGCRLRCQFCHNPDSWVMEHGKPRDIASLLADIEDYKPYIANGGGVTASGGEPLAQPEFLRALFEGSRAMGLHTALDTSGFLGENATPEILAATDLVLLDIKHLDPDAYREITGGELAPTLAFAEKLAKLGKPMWLRFVLVPGLSDDFEMIGRLADYAKSLGNVERVEVLPFHKMGEAKWESLGYPYKLKATEPPSKELTAKVRGIFAERGLEAV